jgi:membrane protease YdiL (CAAX protease family)
MSRQKQKHRLAKESPHHAHNKKVWGPWATIGLGLAVLSALLVTACLIVGIFYLMKPDTSTFGDWLTSMHGLRKGMPLREYLGLRRLSVISALISMGVVVGLVALLDGLGAVLNVPTHDNMYNQMYLTSVWPPLLWIALVIFGPIGGETLFRGFLFEGFYRSNMGTVLTVLLTSAAWTLTDIGSDVYSLFVTFILGLAFGVMRLRTKSLLSPIIMNSTVSLITMIMAAMGV